jgi:hypothetical protein
VGYILSTRIHAATPAPEPATPSERSRAPSPSSRSSTPEPAARPMSVQDTPPLAICCERRNVRPPGEWWRVYREPTPAIESESDSSGKDDRESATSVEYMLADSGNESPDKLALAADALLDSEPCSFKQAMQHPDAAQWLAAASKENAHHEANGTWSLVEVPAGAKILPSLWVFNLKRNPDGTVASYKGRLVAQGNHQRPGFDYSETFVPTFRQLSMRLIMALAAEGDLHMRSVDITSAFTNGNLDEDICYD